MDAPPRIGKPGAFKLNLSNSYLDLIDDIVGQLIVGSSPTGGATILYSNELN